MAPELLVTLGIRVSPRTVRRYMARGRGKVRPGCDCAAVGDFRAKSRPGPRPGVPDFCMAVTATFRVLYVFVALDVGSRRLLYVNFPNRLRYSAYEWRHIGNLAYGNVPKAP